MKNAVLDFIVYEKAPAPLNMNVRRIMEQMLESAGVRPHHWFTRQELAPVGKNIDITSALTSLVSEGRLQTKIEGRQTLYTWG